MGRTYNSLRNVKVNMMGQLLTNVIKFACRTVFIQTLGKEYLGISSLYTNILLLLSVSELGFSNVVTYSLYRPLAEGDEAKIRSIMAFFKKAYRIIGLVILGTGLLLMPFLPVLMNGTTDKVNIYFYYLLYLGQTVISYFFFAYKQTLLMADQKKYVVDRVVFGVKAGLGLTQIVSLWVYPSFLLYTLLSIVSEVVVNLIVSIQVDRRYPYLKQPADKLPVGEIKKVFTQVYAMFLYRVCNIVGQSTDNLIISSHISVLMVGLYDNYAMVIAVLQNVLGSVLGAFTGSLGNLYVLESDEKNERVFRALNLLNLWFIIFSSVCCLVLFQPFITLWVGADYLFDNLVVLIIVMNFATNYMQGVVQIYKDATGLFVRGKYRPVATVILNLGISLILVRSMGIAGVFLGSIISRMCTTWAYDAWLIHRHAFHRSPLPFYGECCMAAVWIIGLSMLVQYIISWLALPISWLGLFLRGGLCVLVVNGALILWYRQREAYGVLKEKVMEMIRKRI